MSIILIFSNPNKLNRNRLKSPKFHRQSKKMRSSHFMNKTRIKHICQQSHITIIKKQTQPAVHIFPLYVDNQ